MAVTGLPPVLVPPRALAPGLHRALRRQGLVLRTAGNSCTTAEQWQGKAATHGWAIPVVRHLDGWHEQPLPIAMQASIGVLLPAERATATQLHLLLEAPRRTISATCTALSQEEMPDSAPQR